MSSFQKSMEDEAAAVCWFRDLFFPGRAEDRLKQWSICPDQIVLYLKSDIFNFLFFLKTFSDTNLSGRESRLTGNIYLRLIQTKSWGWKPTWIKEVSGPKRGLR